ncbi:MAG TPA: replication initiator protein A [Blastocatellia bacterium]|nr:replication initiator protein A [Blastocatellia bacterium]
MKSSNRQKEAPEQRDLTTGQGGEAIVPDFVKVEKNLASLGFFTPPKREIKKSRSKTIRFSRMIGDSRVEAEVKISADEELGLPTTADQDKFLAFQKMVNDQITQTGGISNPVCFQSSDILHLLGLADSGENFKEIERWLDRMTTTTIVSKGAVYFAGKKRWATDRFHVFSRAVSIGKDLGNGAVADRNYVWLSEWQLENLVHNHLLPIDFETYKQIRNHVAKALVPLLQIWLYASREEGVFEKRYDELCQILHLTQYRHASKIREKIGPALDELKRYKYISEWKLEHASDRENFKVVLYHGEKFHEDRRRRLGQAEPDAPGGARNKTGEESAGKQHRPDQGGRREEVNRTGNQTDPESMIERLCQDFRVARNKAVEIVEKYPEETRTQLDAWRFRESRPDNPAGWIIRAIEQNYHLPDGYLEVKQKEEAGSRKAAREAAIAACPYCRHSEGWRFTARGARPCTHDPAHEENAPDLI